MNKRLEILGLIESGELSVEEGVKRLEALGESEEPAERQHEWEMPSPVGPHADEGDDLPCQPSYVSLIWRIVFGAGILVLALGGWLLAGAYGGEEMQGLGWGWVVFVIGLLGMALGWWLRRCHWFYLRVREEGRTKLTLALPLPLELVIWMLRLARPLVPQIQEMEAEQLIVAVQEELREGRACEVRVDDDGDRVELYFG